MIDTVKYDGVTLTNTWAIVNVVRNSSQMTSKTQTVQGRPGAVFMGAVPAPLQVSFVALIKDQASANRRASSRLLRAALQKDGPRRLEFSDDGGLYYLAELKSIKETLYRGATAWQVTFDVFEPFLIDSNTKSVTSSTGASITTAANAVGGTANAYPVVDIVGATKGTNGYVEIKIDNGTPMRVNLTSSSRVVIDCDPAKRSVLVNNVAKMLTIDSDWWELTPNVAHTFAVTYGSASSFTVSWADRWVV